MIKYSEHEEIYFCDKCGYYQALIEKMTNHLCPEDTTELRDKFAMAALPEIMKNEYKTTMEEDFTKFFNEVANLAYKQADAMLEARQK